MTQKSSNLGTQIQFRRFHSISNISSTHMGQLLPTDENIKKLYFHTWEVIIWKMVEMGRYRCSFIRTTIPYGKEEISYSSLCPYGCVRVSVSSFAVIPMPYIAASDIAAYIAAYTAAYIAVYIVLARYSNRAPFFLSPLTSHLTCLRLRLGNEPSIRFSMITITVLNMDLFSCYFELNCCMNQSSCHSKFRFVDYSSSY